MIEKYTCELTFWARDHKWGKCRGGLEYHHVISKNMLRNNKQGKKLVEKTYPHLFMARVCSAHNAWHKVADHSDARLYLIELRRQEYGVYMEEALEELRATFKVIPPDLR